MKRNDEKLNEWRLLLAEQKQRQIPIKRFCQDKNISPSRFYYYQDIISKTDKIAKDLPKENNKLKLKNKNRDIIKPIQLIQSPPKEPSMIRFIFPNNLQCVLPRDMATHEVKAILEMMMSC